MSHFRQLPKGVGHSLGENTRRNMTPMYLDDMIESGNRAQRRFAVRKLRKLKNKSGGRS